MGGSPRPAARGVEEGAKRLVHLAQGDQDQTGSDVAYVAVALGDAEPGPGERTLQPFGARRSVPEQNDPGSAGAVGRQIIDQASD